MSSEPNWHAPDNAGKQIPDAAERICFLICTSTETHSPAPALWHRKIAGLNQKGPLSLLPFGVRLLPLALSLSLLAFWPFGLFKAAITYRYQIATQSLSTTTFIPNKLVKNRHSDQSPLHILNMCHLYSECRLSRDIKFPGNRTHAQLVLNRLRPAASMARRLIVCPAFQVSFD